MRDNFLYSQPESALQPELQCIKITCSIQMIDQHLNDRSQVTSKLQRQELIVM